MRIALTGAAGDFGTAILRALLPDERVDEVVCIDIAEPRLIHPKARTKVADVRSPELARLLEGCEAVVHLAFVIVPGRDVERARSINRDGSRNVLEAAAAAGVRRLVVASSSSAMGPPRPGAVADDDSAVEPDPDHAYFDDKAAVERMIEDWERDHPKAGLVVTRLRPGFVFGPDFDNPALALLGRSPAVVPADGGTSQIVHQDDIARAFCRVCFEDQPGPFLLTTDDAVTTEEIGAISGARTIRVPVRAAELALDAAHAIRLSPVSSSWAVSGDRHGIPARARAGLGWEAAMTSAEAAQVMMLQRGRFRRWLDGPPRREVLERALEVPTAFLRRAVGRADPDRPLDRGGPGAASEPNPGVEGIDLDGALARLEHDFVRFRDLAVHLEVHEARPREPAAAGARAATIVVHHGLGDHARRFTPLAARLVEEGFNVVAVDRPGHGLSEGRRGHCTLEWALELVEASIRYARERFGGPVAMLGDSLGGITLWYALTHEIDADAVICHCISHPDVAHEPAMRLKAPIIRALGRIAPHASVPIRRIADYGEVALSPATQAYFDAEVDRVFCFSSTAGSMASYLRFRPRIPWERVTTPVQVVIGAADAMTTPEVTRRCFERARPPAADYVEIPDAGHQLYLDHLDRSFGPLVDWTREALSGTHGSTRHRRALIS